MIENTHALISKDQKSWYTQYTNLHAKSVVHTYTFYCCTTKSV